MKAITVRQPWASLIAAQVKTIETRPRPTNHRGRIALHASKSTAGIDALPGDCEGKREGGWTYGYAGDYQASYCRVSSDEGHRGDTCLSGPGIEIEDEYRIMPLGAVVASAVLTDCVPIIGTREEAVPASFIAEYEDESDGDPELPHHRGGLWLIGSNNYSHGKPTRIEDQRPFGDFSPGRWALLLDDIAPTTARCPWCWGDGGAWEPSGVPEWSDEMGWACEVCDGEGVCEPVPARGRQAVPWDWEPGS